VKIRKAGEIINQVVEVVKKSPDHDYYMKEFEDFMNREMD
jgi:NAD-dependent DNA ligase